jgi:phospholipid-translocating ATPase
MVVVVRHSQHMNRYFLLIAFLQLWSEITPVNPLTTWVPLACIFLVTSIKEGMDDWRRHKADQLANNRPVWVIRMGKKIQVT